jgi:hypothetical protein
LHSGRDVLIAAKEIGGVEFRFERYQLLIVGPISLPHAIKLCRGEAKDELDRVVLYNCRELIEAELLYPLHPIIARAA